MTAFLHFYMSPNDELVIKIHRRQHHFYTSILCVFSQIQWEQLWIKPTTKGFSHQDKTGFHIVERVKYNVYMDCVWKSQEWPIIIKKCLSTWRHQSRHGIQAVGLCLCLSQRVVWQARKHMAENYTQPSGVYGEGLWTQSVSADTLLSFDWNFRVNTLTQAYGEMSVIHITRWQEKRATWY